MKIIIIGCGTLSTALVEKFGIENSILLSSRDIVETPTILIDIMNNIDNCFVILNCFQKSTKLLTASLQEIMKHSIENVVIILEILTAYAAKINKLIYTSSSAVYGANSNGQCVETMHAAPINMHGILKFACEQLIRSYCEKNKVDYTIARLFNLFGGQDEFSIISRLINAFCSDKALTLLNNGRAIRDYIHIDDIAWAYAKLLTVTQVPILNIASGQGVSTQALIETIQSRGTMQLVHAARANEIIVSIANTALAEKHLGKHTYLSVFSFLTQQCDSLSLSH